MCLICASIRLSYVEEADSARRLRFRKSLQKRASDLDSMNAWIPKLDVVGSSPISRSMLSHLSQLILFGPDFKALKSDQSADTARIRLRWSAGPRGAVMRGSIHDDRQERRHVSCLWITDIAGDGRWNRPYRSRQR